MGAWGYKLFENDFTMDIKDTIEYSLDSKIPTSFIISDLKMHFPLGELEPIEKLQFWIAIGYTIWLRGYKNESVLKKALHSINEYRQMLDLNFEGYQIVIDELNQIEKTLKTDPPKVKRTREKYICPWKLDDVFAYPIKKDPYGNHQLTGAYLILHKVGESNKYLNSVFPIVEIKIALNGKLPITKEDIDDLDYMIVGIRKKNDVSHNFTHILDQVRPYDTNSDHNYCIDNDGYLRFYQYIISGDSNSDIPEKLIYLGNFRDLKPPLDGNYYLPQYDATSGCYWKDFDNVMMWLYHGITLKEKETELIETRLLRKIDKI